MMGNWMGGQFVLYGLIWLLVVGAVVVALLRSMQAQERIARHLEGIERALSQRPQP